MPFNPNYSTDINSDYQKVVRPSLIASKGPAWVATANRQQMLDEYNKSQAGNQDAPPPLPDAPDLVGEPPAIPGKEESAPGGYLNTVAQNEKNVWKNAGKEALGALTNMNPLSLAGTLVNALGGSASALSGTPNTDERGNLKTMTNNPNSLLGNLKEGLSYSPLNVGGIDVISKALGFGSTLPQNMGGNGGQSSGEDPFTPLINQATNQLSSYGSISMSNPTMAAKYAPYVEKLNNDIKGWQEDRKNWFEGKQKFGYAPFGSDAQKDAAATGEVSERMLEKKHQLWNVLNDPKISGADKVQQVRNIVESITADTALMEGFKRIPGGLQAVNEVQAGVAPESIAGWLDKNGEIVPAKLKGTIQGMDKVSAILDNKFDTLVRQNRATPEEANRFYKYYKPGGYEVSNNGDIRKQNQEGYEKAMNPANGVFAPEGTMAQGAQELASAGGKAAGQQEASRTAGRIGALLDWGTHFLGISPPKGVNLQEFALDKKHIRDARLAIKNNPEGSPAYNQAVQNLEIIKKKQGR